MLQREADEWGQFTAAEDTNLVGNHPKSLRAPSQKETPLLFLQPQDSSSHSGSNCHVDRAIHFPPGTGAMGLHCESHYCSFTFLRIRHST